MNLDAQHMLLLVALAVVGHVLLFALYRRAHPVMLLLMAFVLASMLSTATLLPGVVGIKWARVYVTILAVAIALVCVRPRQLGAGAWAMLGFGVVYVLAAVWSGDPVGGLMFKGMFLVTLVLGMAAVFVARDYAGLWTLQRCIVLAAGVVVCVLLAGVAANPGALLGGGRLALFGLNPNRIAETLAPLIVFCVFGLLYEPARSWRVLCYVVVLPAMALLLATGSRAGFSLVMIGFVVLMLPLVRRPGVFAAAALIVGMGGLLVLSVVGETRAYQVGEYSFDNRFARWGAALALFRERPLIGVGWEYWQTGRGYGSSVNLLNIYLQVLAETGLVGFSVMLAALGRVAWSGWQALRLTVGQPELRAFVYLAGALFVAVAAHGVAESGALMGSSLTAACLGLSVAMFDWLLATARARWAWAMSVQASAPAEMTAPVLHPG